ncbi:hypothetical protein PC39_05730 [Salinisphaera sp. PC39]|uniref:MgtC/SapB family protein n=1 Tax=Salinisphaera sp. PC39 TaxID=1304156 RepID=UPI0033404EEC
MDSTTALTDLWALGIALALGLLVGLERGWHEREAAEGRRIAGIRTFALIGLLGGLAQMLGRSAGPATLPVAFAALAAILLVAHALESLRDRDAGITTLVAALLTFLLGALAVAGHAEVATAAAVVSGLILGSKPRLHAALQRISEDELRAVFKLLLISLVALPLIPDRGYGPGGVLNPYEIWWLVVLIAALSSTGYFAMRLAGPGRGLMLTAALGGLASSTALTLSFARLHRRAAGLHAPLSAGILLACAMMFPRIWVETALVRPSLTPALTAPLVVMAAVAAAALLWRRPGRSDSPGDVARTLANPFELRTALQFGVLLAGVMLLSHYGRIHFGDEGVYLVAAIAALSDVDAITLALARAAGGDLDAEVARRAIVLSAAVNTLTKGVIAAAIGGPRMWRSTALPLALAGAAGIATTYLI